MTLRFDVAGDLSGVRGWETLQFTPDLLTCELVFRAWPNEPQTARAGNALTVTSVAVAGQPVQPRVEAAGAPAGAPGTLIEVPLPACVEAGGTIEAEIQFTLTLGRETDERVGYSPEWGVAWFASAYPLLAWERERGWARDPAVDLWGETTTSEVFRLAALDVAAPSQFGVAGTGSAGVTRPGDTPGTTVHQFSAEAVRDVAVSVGQVDVIEREVDGVRLHVAGGRRPGGGAGVPLEMWAQMHAESIRRLVRLLGPFPYADLWVSVLPGIQGGIEFPGAIQYGDADPAQKRALISHETAHMWFYGLVGNNQARDPWLDEAFATYAQAVADEDEARYLAITPAPLVAGKVGQPTTYWEKFGRYSEGVYVQGAAALLRARAEVGPERFDVAMRTYLDTNAHRIVIPDDVALAFAELPPVLDHLRRVGALADPPAPSEPAAGGQGPV